MADIYGFRVYDDSNNLVVDISDRLGRFIGSVVTTAAAGSITVPEFEQGTPFYACQSLYALGFNTSVQRITISDKTLSWTAGSGGSLVIYGVY